MRELVSTLTSKGQVTIPIEVRRFLKVKPREKIAFVVEQGRVEIKRTESVTQRTAGILRGAQPALSAEEERATAERGVAEEAEPGARA